MKFLVSPTRDALSRSRPPVRLFLGFALVLLAALVAQRALAGGLTPAGVFEYYLGTGEPGTGLPLTALVEELHGAAFLYGFLLLMLGSLLVVSPLGARSRAVLTWGATLACALDLAAPFVVTWLGTPAAATLRVASSLTAMGFLAAGAAALLLRFGRDGGAA
ncbi:MAG: hypothetical protein AB1730_18260 [Myxococcota bacterium]